MTHSYVEMKISAAAWLEIAELLKAANYKHVFEPSGRIDMTGIAIYCDESAETDLEQSISRQLGAFNPRTPDQVGQDNLRATSVENLIAERSEEQMNCLSIWHRTRAYGSPFCRICKSDHKRASIT
jgi:hypothetical protein